MAYKLQRKETPGSAWYTIGSGYSESNAYMMLAQYQAKYPKSYFRIVDQSSNRTVHTV